MTYTTTIFDDSIDLTLPDEFIPPANVPATTATQQDKYQFLFTHRKDRNTQILGGLSWRKWGDANVEELLNLYADVLRQTMPMLQIAQMATLQTPDSIHGVIQYSFASLWKRWMGFLSIFPTQSHVGVLMMTCSKKHSLERGQQFMDIIESITPHIQPSSASNPPKQV